MSNLKSMLRKLSFTKATGNQDRLARATVYVVKPVQQNHNRAKTVRTERVYWQKRAEK